MRSVPFINENILKQIIPVLIAVILVAILLTQISVKDIITAFLHINLLCVVAGFVLYVGTDALRAWRFNILLNKEVSIKDLFLIECLHSMLVNLLPARTGELSYIYLLEKEHGKSTGVGLATLIVTRIFDGIFLAISFIVFYFLIRDLPLIFQNIMMVVPVFLVFMVLVLIMVLFYGSNCLKILNKVTRHLNGKIIHIGDFIQKKGQETVDSIDTFKTGKTGLPPSVVIITFGIWVSTFAFFYLLALSIDLPLNTLQILFASGFALFTLILPVQGIGGFGTMEGGWALGFIAVGLSSEMAISSGFVFHIINLSFALILGAFGYVLIRISKQLSHTHKEV